MPTLTLTLWEHMVKVWTLTRNRFFLIRVYAALAPKVLYAAVVWYVRATAACGQLVLQEISRRSLKGGKVVEDNADSHALEKLKSFTH